MASHNSLMQKATDADGLLTAAHADVMKHCPTLLIFCFASYTAVYGAYIVMHISHSTILFTHMPIKFHIIIHVCVCGKYNRKESLFLMCYKYVATFPHIAALNVGQLYF